MKKTKRKAFNFLRSYYDLYNELKTDKQKIEFVNAIFAKQFHNKDTDLEGIVKLAYMGCHHQIEKSVKGYMDKTKDPMVDPCQGGCKGPSLQEEEQEEEQEEVEYTKPKKPKIPKFEDFLNHCKTLPNYTKDYDFPIRSKYDAWVENGWKDLNNNKIKNWKTKLNNTWPHMKPVYTNGKPSSPQTVSFKNKI